MIALWSAILAAARSQVLSTQDLEMQNNELVEANQKLQKELNALRNLAKEAIMEKKKSQTALETLKHQVVHLLGQHDMVPKQSSPTHASQGNTYCPICTCHAQLFP